MRAIDCSRVAEIVAVMGATGAGKSMYIKGRIRKEKPARLLIWDPEGEYEGFGRDVSSLGELVKLLQGAGRKSFRFVFRPVDDLSKAKKQFDMFCNIAFAAKDLRLIAEELKFVTSPSYAPPGWSKINLRGRKHGITVIGTSQRPASIDKDFLGNATLVRAGRMNYEEDAKAVAKVLGVPVQDVMLLEPLEFIERRPPAAATRGKMKV